VKIVNWAASATAIFTGHFDGMSDIGDKIHWHSPTIALLNIVSDRLQAISLAATSL